jgi:hypothetical protein
LELLACTFNLSNRNHITAGILFRFLMRRVGSAEATIFFKFQLVRRRPLVLRRCIISSFAF